MIFRWKFLIAAFAVAALTCTLLGSSAPRAGESGLQQVAAGPGDSAEPGDAAGPGEAPDEGPGAAPGDGPGGPGDEPEAGAPEPQPQAGKPDEGAPPSAAEEAPPPGAAPTEGQPEPAEAPKEEAAPPPQQEAEAPPPGKDPSGIEPPKDPLALAAFNALERNCARCHQVGPLLQKPKPQKGFGYVLQLDQLVNESGYIVPGVPDGSQLFQLIQNHVMPYDCYQEGDCDAGPPTKEEVTAIYDWIKSVGNPVCADRKPVDQVAIVEAIAGDLDQQQEERRKGMRYITLSNLYNQCTSDSDMLVYRQGVIKLLNSLSTNPDVLKLRTIDPAKTIIAFNLDDLNWTEADWNLLLAAYPYPMRPDVTAYETVKTLTDTPLAWIRGDWFAFAASRPPLYYDLLKMPATFDEFAKSQNVDVKRNIEKFLVQRSGFRKSGVSEHNRLIERHKIATGYFWTSYDFKGDKPEQSLFQHPLGPDGDNAFHHDGGESIFSLPNGFQAFYLNTSKGERLSTGPIEIVRDDTQHDRLVTNGISCFGCHKVGINRNVDEIRDRIGKDLSFSSEVRKQVAALYPTKEVMNDILDQDTKRYTDAMERAGLLTDIDVDSRYESINLLSKRYEKDLLAFAAASEFDLTPEAFAERLNNVGGKFIAVKQQLQQGQLPRGQMEPQFKELISLVSEDLPVDVGGPAPKADAPKVADSSEITLVADRSDYKVNDLPVFTVTPKNDCNLTVINVDAKGEGVVIYPNPFEQNNHLGAGKSVQIPPADGKWQFRLKDPGTETVIAVCNAEGKDVDGIKHDFKNRAFTELGNYREFATRQIVAETKGKTGEAPKPSADPKVDTSGVTRAAIKLDVK